jgi:hypothetical protein
MSPWCAACGACGTRLHLAVSRARSTSGHACERARASQVIAIVATGLLLVGRAGLWCFRGAQTYACASPSSRVRSWFHQAQQQIFIWRRKQRFQTPTPCPAPGQRQRRARKRLQLAVSRAAPRDTLAMRTCITGNRDCHRYDRVCISLAGWVVVSRRADVACASPSSRVRSWFHQAQQQIFF